MANELHKSITRKFHRIKLYLSCPDIIWDADLADLQLTSKFNKEIRPVLCILDIFSKHIWFVTFKDKKGIRSTNLFKKMYEFGCKPNKIQLDQCSEHGCMKMALKCIPHTKYKSVC